MRKLHKQFLTIAILIIAVALLISSVALNRQVQSLSRKLAALVSSGPTISNQIYINVTQTTATILWDTDRIATTQISLGTSATALNLLQEYNTPAQNSGSISHRYDLTNLSPCTRYYFRIVSTDVAGNKTTTSAYALDTHGCGQASGDATAPAPVTNLRVTNTTQTSATLSWDAASDPSGIYRYYIFGGNGTMGNRQQLAVVSGSLTTFTIEGLTVGTTYTGEYGATAGFMIQAVDNANNFSLPSGRITIVMPQPVSTAAPSTTTSAITGWWTNSQVSVPLVCTPGNGTTCTGTYYKFISNMASGCPAADPTVYLTGVTATTIDQGLYDLCFWSEASNGTRETPHRIGPFGLDKTKPTGQVTFPTTGSTVTGVMTVTTSSADALSGVQKVVLSIDSREAQTVTTPPYSFTVSTNSYTEGQHNVLISVYDNAGNSSSSSRIYFNVEVCQTLLTNGSTFSSKLNPTGDPIGGGKCYRNIISRTNAWRVVATKADLLSALAQATAGQIIYVDDSVTIDLTGSAPITIPGGVTLASGRGKSGSKGALLYSKSLYQTDTPLFTTGGDGVRITGLRIRGPYEGVGDHNYSAGIALGFKNNHNNTELDNNEFWAWQKWAVWLYKIGGANNQNGARVHHNYFHDTMNNGYGYHIWNGGAGSETNVLSTIEANLFGPSREVVDAHSGAHSYTFAHNVIMDNHLYRNILRHGGSECAGLRGLSGDVTKVIENLFFTKDVESVAIGTPRTTTGSNQIIDNWFSGSYASDSTQIPAAAGYCDSSTGAYSDLTPNQAIARDARIIVSGNHVNGQGRQLPVASFTASATVINEGDTITFDASASSDPLGSKIIHYRWRFADGEGAFSGGDNDSGYRANERWDVKSTTYTFTKPGYYDVELVVFNAYGIPSEKTYKKILVRPNTSRGTHVLTAWVKDSFDRSTMPGRYEHQLVLYDVVGTTLSNPIVVWRQDVNGAQGWIHPVVSLDGISGLSLTPGTKKAVAYRLMAVGNPTGPAGIEGELWAWVDNMYLFGTTQTIQDPGFEIDGGPTSPWEVRPNTLSSMFVSEMMRGGEMSFRLRFGDGTSPSGTNGYLYQIIQF